MNADAVVSIPYDVAAFGTAMNNGEMISKSSGKSKAVEALRQLASVVSARAPVAASPKKGFSLFKRN